MRLRGLVFERFASFERAEADLCDEEGRPLDVILFVGESGSGKSALLRAISGILTEAAGGEAELALEDVRRGTEGGARCRIVFDDVIAQSRVVVTIEKELPRPPTGSGLRAAPPEGFDRWRRAIERDDAPRAAFSVASARDEGDETLDAPARSLEDTIVERRERDPLVEWLRALAGTSRWIVATRALDRVLWPCRFERIDQDGELVFTTPSGEARSTELGDGFESVLVMALELMRLSMDRPREELLYVIDDIDAHLHPRWQARLVGDLRRAFPRVQLVATTQSPWIVASVEPSQVFRLERPPPTKPIEITPGTEATPARPLMRELEQAPVSVTRVADRIKRGDPSSSVMELAFGSPDLPGPRWAHVPACAVRQDVLGVLADDLPRGAVVYAFPEPVHAKDVRNAFGEHALPGIEGIQQGHLFFVDLAPGIPWGHPCEFVFRTREGVLARRRSIWPPPDLERFVAVGRG